MLNQRPEEEEIMAEMKNVKDSAPGNEVHQQRRRRVQKAGNRHCATHVHYQSTEVGRVTEDRHYDPDPQEGPP